MKRIYLDQNIWVELAAARCGTPRAKPAFRRAYRLARQAVTLGKASFVLSFTHVYETQKQPDWDRRLNVVETMVELSRLHTIAHVTSVVPMEVNYAVARMVGVSMPEPAVFGSGILNLLSMHGKLPAFPAGVEWQALGHRPSFARLLDAYGPAAWELLHLAGPRPRPGPPSRLELVRQQLRRVDEHFADGQQELAKKIAELRLRGTKQLEHGLAQYTLIEIRRHLIRAALQHGSASESIADAIAKNPTDLLQQLPSRHVIHGMYMQHAHLQRRWEPNDLHHITALGVAVPYCDIVVTERHWADMIRRRQLDTTYHTAIMTRGEDLARCLSTL